MPSDSQTRVPAPDDGSRGMGEGWAPFMVDARHDECAIITSFVLRPQSGAALPAHRPGQHLTLKVALPGAEAVTRNYTVSAAPNGETLRISVKREPGGRVSNWLHDHAAPGTVLSVLAPSGSFVLPEDAGRPLVLLSAGVGVTPMISMLEAIAARPPGAPVLFAHGTHDGETHAFGGYVQAMAAGRPEITRATFYSRPRGGDAAGKDFDHAGRLELSWVLDHSDVAQAEYFICGPLPFMRSFVGGLRQAGVPAQRIHTEFFGDVEDLMEDDGAPPTGTPTEVTTRPVPIVSGAAIGDDDVGKALLGSASDAVIASDRDGTIVLWNPGAERIFGFTAAEAVGQSLDIIIPEPFRARHWEGYHQTVASGQSRYGAGDLLAVPGLCKDGRKISIEFTIVLLKDASGQVQGMASSVRDVSRRFEEMKTLRKQVEGLQRARDAQA